MHGAPDMAFAKKQPELMLLPFAAVSWSHPSSSQAEPRCRLDLVCPDLGPEWVLGMDMAIFAIHISGILFDLGALNIIVNVLNMRARGDLFKMPNFAWTGSGHCLTLLT